MISIYNIKPKFQQLLRPVLERLHRAGITANQLTLSAIILSGFIALALWNADAHSWLLLAAPAGLLLRMALNALDGMMARTYNMQSKKGELLNEFGDVLSDIMIYIPLVKINPALASLIWIFVLLSIFNEFAGLLAKVVSGTRRYDGPMGKSDRAFLIGAFCLLCYCYPQMPVYTGYVFTLAIVLLLISTYTRLVKSLK